MYQETIEPRHKIARFRHDFGRQDLRDMYENHPWFAAGKLSSASLARFKTPRVTWSRLALLAVRTRVTGLRFTPSRSPRKAKCHGRNGSFGSRLRNSATSSSLNGDCRGRRERSTFSCRGATGRDAAKRSGIHDTIRLMSRTSRRSLHVTSIRAILQRSVIDSGHVAPRKQSGSGIFRPAPSSMALHCSSTRALPC